MRKTGKAFKAMAITMSAVLLLSGCGAQSDSETSAASEAGTQAEQNVAGTETEAEEAKAYWEMLDEVSDTSELPDWQGETLEVNVWFAAATYGTIGEIPETDVCYKELERVTGVRFNVDECYDNGGNNIDAKLPMVIASGDYPTLIVGYDIGKQLAELYEEGYLADLTQYYEDGTLDQLLKYLPLEDGEPYVYKNCKAEDGSYYLIPNGEWEDIITVWNASGYSPEDYDALHYATYGQSPRNYSGMNTNNAILVREDILQALLPETLTTEEIEQIYMENGGFTEDQIFDVGLHSSEDFFQFLRDLKTVIEENDFTGLDGKPVEVIAGPHTETDNWGWMVSLPKLMDGAPEGTDYFCTADYTPADEASVLQWGFSSDYYVNYMKELNQLVREDVISQNSLLDNSASFNEKCENGRYAVLYGGQYWPYDADHEEWTYRPIWVDTEFNSQKTGGFSTVGYSNYFGIFKDSLTEEQLDQLMHAVNYLNSKVGIDNFFWGPRTAGLFTEDADGNRTYADEELYDCIINNVDNGAATKYGIYNTSPTTSTFRIRPVGIAHVLYRPAYLMAENKERSVNDARTYFNPGTLEGGSKAENAVFVTTNCEVYGSLGVQIEALNTFWNARNGFENQMKKVIVAETDAEFERQYQELLTYAVSNGLTDEALAEFNELFVETNRDALTNSGIIK